MKLLDCTLRDGGYWTDWNYNLLRAKGLVKDVISAGVNIVELGYCLPTNIHGAYKHLTVPDCVALTDGPPDEEEDAEFAVMTDIGTDIDGLFPKASESPIDYVRLVGYFDQLPKMPEMAKRLKGLGYKVTVNTMAVSTLSKAQVAKAIDYGNVAGADVIYFADSFSGLKPADVFYLWENIRKRTDTPVGFHFHNGQRLAYANAMTAMQCGCEYLDASVMGMGRGPGNVPLECVCANPQALLTTMDDFILPLHRQYGWGPSYLYQYAGERGMHPTYAQALAGHSLTDAIAILERVPDDACRRYNRDTLDEARRENARTLCDTSQVEFKSLPR